MLTVRHILVLLLYSQHLMQHIQASAPFHNFNGGYGTAAFETRSYEDTFENHEDWQPKPPNNLLLLKTTADTRQAHKPHKQRTYLNRNRSIILQHQESHIQRYPPNYYVYKHNRNNGKKYFPPPDSQAPVLMPTTTETSPVYVTPASHTLVTDKEQNAYILTLNNLLRADILARQQISVPLTNERKMLVMPRQHIQKLSSNTSQSVESDSKNHKVYNNDIAANENKATATRSNQIATDKDIAVVNAEQQMTKEILVPLANVLSKLQEFCGIAKQMLEDDDADGGYDADPDDDDDEKFKITKANAGIDLLQADIASKAAADVQGQFNIPVKVASISTTESTDATATTTTATSPAATARSLAKSLGVTWTSIGTARKKVKKIKKAFKKLLLPLLIAYKLKFLTLIPVLIGGLTLLVGTTGLAGFFFALFTAVMSLKSTGGKSIIVKNL